MTDDTELETLTVGMDAEAIARLARDGVAPHTVKVGDGPSGAVDQLWFGNGPDGHRLIHIENLQEKRSRPAMKAGDVQVDTPEALITYAERHLDESTTTLWAQVDRGRITVILNDHGDVDDIAGWADHRAMLTMRRAEEWDAWTGIAGQWTTQHDLALFIEEHLQDIAEPDGSTLLEVTQTFHAISEATFTSTRRLADGTQHLVWTEDVNATAGRDQHTAIPTDLTLHLRPWVGVAPEKVDAKFRFRVRDGHLSLRVDLLRTADISRRAVEAAAVDAATQLGVPMIEGTAPSARR
jgi:uncharacterized protein YfdQ (DUF2303 family)